MNYFSEITKDELKEKVEDFLTSQNINIDYSWPEMHKQIEKDIATIVQVNFGRTETMYNIEFVSKDTMAFTYIDPDKNPFEEPEDQFMGYHTYENGLSFLGCLSGEDWEEEVYYIIYWDGKSLRGYVPKLGNLWNTGTKIAYGNDFDEDRLGNEPHYDIYNLKERFKEGTLQSDHITSDDFCKLTGPEIDELLENAYLYNFELMKQDILNNFTSNKHFVNKDQMENI